MKKIKSFEDACKVLGIKPKHLPSVGRLPEKHKNAIIAHYKLVIIAEALNEGWKPNWKDLNEWKYYPWFRMSGSGFAFGDFGYGHSNTNVGSRLVFKSEELARYAGTKFKKLYQQYMVLK